MNVLSPKYRWMLLAAVPLLAWLLLFDGGFLEQRGYHARLDSLQGLKLQLEGENERISGEINALRRKDPRLLEEEARKIGMVRPGDEVYYLVTDEDTTRLNDQRRGEPIPGPDQSGSSTDPPAEPR
ncbi:MAG: septum formation initiator family protein [Candidatus Delongbacteria bacterium]|nr:septum formation initiator family protein [Candidatus Delongbacteria bacterium]